MLFIFLTLILFTPHAFDARAAPPAPRANAPELPQGQAIDRGDDGWARLEECHEELPDGEGEIYWYPDLDGDGFGDAGAEPIGSGCEPLIDAAPNNLDCDDSDSKIHPDADEICDGIDNNCNDLIDEGLQRQWWPDADGDGFGDANGSKVEDCHDLGPDYVRNDEDCDDSDPEVHPEADEICDGIDNNCNDLIDEGLPTKVWWPDLDGDGFGDANGPWIEDCRDLGPDYVGNDGDCDDSDPSVHPDAVEECDGIDNNCNDLIDEGLEIPWWPDADGDGYGDRHSVSVLTCHDMPGYATNDGDCDDSDPWVHPDAVEECDGIDNDCNGLIDDGLPTSVWYEDLDGDGYGNDGVTLEACYLPSGYASVGGDCDDNDPLIHGYTTWYADADGDGFGDPWSWTQQCQQPDGYVLDSTDCDDTDALTYPGAPELCDEKDNDCDGFIDNGLPTFDWYLDEDGDGYGAGMPVQACAPPEGHVGNGEDCDDADPTVHPGAEERCDGKDNTCDGWIDLDPDGEEVCADPPEEDEGDEGDDPDPGADEAPMAAGDPIPPGCVCTTGSGTTGGWLGVTLLGLALHRRRRPRS